MQIQEGYKLRAIDTGFIVFNAWPYPNVMGVMDALGVESTPTEISFSVSSQRTGF